MKDKYIPIYTVDKEARIFLGMILNYFADTFDEFARIRNYFYLADSYIGCDNMEKLFKDKIRNICRLVRNEICSGIGKLLNRAESP